MSISRDTVTVRAVAPRPHQPVRCLAVISGPNAGEVIRVRDEMVIGRAPEAGFRPADRGVSREHVVITLNRNRVRIRDLSSRNGTYIDGHRISDTELHDGDQFTIGQTTFLLFTLSTLSAQPTGLRLGIGGLGVRDPATGLYTRRFFLQRLQQDLDISSHRRRSLLVSLLEIQRIEQLRAAHSAQFLGECVAGVARRLSATVRVEDLVARYDDHRFAILCCGVPISVGRQIADRCAEEVAASSPMRAAPALRVSLAVGTVDADSGEFAQQIMLAAEEVVERAKQAWGG